MKNVITLLFFALLAATALAACGGNGASPPDRIALPAGFQPEGIAARDNFIFVGSIPTGAVYRADINTGTGAVLVPSREGRSAIGLKIDNRGRIFVAGGATGQGFVYDAATGADLAVYIFTTGETFVNDVIITADAAWFTDSRNPVLYRIPLPADGTLVGREAVITLPLSGDFQLEEGAFNLNGIAAAGDRLVVVQSSTGFLFTVDPATGITARIDLGAETLPNGDGILLEGLTLFVVQNQLNQVAVVDLTPDLTGGTVRTRITSPAFDVPTTIAAAGSGLYVVNARFGITVTPDTPYSVVRIDQP